MDLETCVTIGYLFKKITILPFLAFFSTFPRAQTIRIICLTFFQWAGVEKLVYMIMHINSIPIL